MAKIKKEFKNRFTTVSNDFLFDQRMATAERGLLITMLGLPDTWDFNVRGLAAILPNGESSLKSSLRKLEELGYLKRTPIRESGRFVDTEYTFSDTPLFLEYGEKLRLEREIKKAERTMETNKEGEDSPLVENPLAVNPPTETPIVENPLAVKPIAENRPDNISIKELNTKELSIIDNQSIYQSNSMTPIEQMKDTEKKLKMMDGRMDSKSKQSYEKLIKDNIEYDIMIERYPYDRDRFDEITNILIETLDTPRETVNIEGHPKPWETVCGVLVKLTSSHIDYVIDSLNRNTTDIRNIKAYILTALYNSYFTIGNYYSARVKHDMPWLAK
jgi:hypothetical protein